MAWTTRGSAAISVACIPKAVNESVVKLFMDFKRDKIVRRERNWPWRGRKIFFEYCHILGIHLALKIILERGQKYKSATSLARPRSPQ
jgi:hypothetical protein